MMEQSRTLNVQNKIFILFLDFLSRLTRNLEENFELEKKNVIVVQAIARLTVDS